MLHPFTDVQCEVVSLQPGATLEASDLYRSATLAANGQAISPEAPGVGKWCLAGDILHGSTVHPECNVTFIRLVPSVQLPDGDGLSDVESEKLLLQALHAVE